MDVVESIDSIREDLSAKRRSIWQEYLFDKRKFVYQEENYPVKRSWPDKKQFIW